MVFFCFVRFTTCFKPSILESIWTVTPAIILIAIAFPSFRLLYLLDEVISPTITIKVVGRQWFWSYELE